MIDVIPAILEKEFAEIEKKMKRVEPFVSWVQIDIMDGTLMPGLTFRDAEPFKKLNSGLTCELHLMVNNPARYLEPFAAVGFKRFYAQVEGEGIEDYLVQAAKMNVEVGLSLDGPSAVEKVWPYLDNIDCLLVMGVDAGESGRPFREDTVEKISKIHDVYFDLPISVDGAMTLENAAKVVAAGATRINSNSYLFKAPDIEAAITSIRNLDQLRT